MGFTKEEYDMQRYFRNCRQLIFAPITNEMSKNFLGEAMSAPKILLGSQAEYVSGHDSMVKAALRFLLP